MAEVMEHKEYASNAKANAGLTTGIIGTSLAGLLAIKSGMLNGILGGGCGCNNTWNNGCGDGNVNVPYGSLYNERKECQDYIDLTKQYYEGQLATQATTVFLNPPSAFALTRFSRTFRNTSLLLLSASTTALIFSLKDTTSRREEMTIVISRFPPL